MKITPKFKHEMDNDLLQNFFRNEENTMTAVTSTYKFVGPPGMSPAQAGLLHGIDIARDFFLNWALPWLKHHRPACVERIAAGLFFGSDVLRTDDALSRDHAWGPHFDIYYLDADKDLLGEKLYEEINAAAPKVWNDANLRSHHSAGLESIEKRFGGIFKGKRLPECDVDWLPVGEHLDSALYYVRHGGVFYDPAGIMGGVQQKLRDLPHDLWLKRMSQLCFNIAHYGEYNFCWRLTKRCDALSIQMALGHFTEALLRISLIMDRDHAPYWKWLHHEVKKRPVSAAIDAQLEQLCTSCDLERRCDIVKGLCNWLFDELVKREILPANLDNGSGVPIFFQAKAYLEKQIKNEQIRA
jgi:hypothetical protein